MIWNQIENAQTQENDQFQAVLSDRIGHQVEQIQAVNLDWDWVAICHLERGRRPYHRLENADQEDLLNIEHK